MLLSVLLYTCLPLPARLLLDAIALCVRRCYSAMAFSGVKRVCYFFTYEDSRDAFSMPLDLSILEDVFGSSRPRNANQFFTAWGLREAISHIDGEDGDRLRVRVDAIVARYAALAQLVTC